MASNESNPPNLYTVQGIQNCAKISRSKSNHGRRLTMATSSIGTAIVFTDEMADRLIEQMEEVEANPPKPRTVKIKWGDPKKFAEALHREYSDAK
jgi:hypothetical protein